MLNQLELEKRVCDIVKAVTGLAAKQIIIGDPNDGSPAGPYAAVRMQNPEQFGAGSVTTKTSAPAIDDPRFIDDLTTVETQTVASFSINFYRTGALGFASALMGANYREPVKNIMRAAGLGWSRLGPLNNLTELYQGSKEQRAQITLYLYAASRATDRVQRIYNVEFSVQSETIGPVTQGEVSNGLSS